MTVGEPFTEFYPRSRPSEVRAPDEGVFPCSIPTAAVHPPRTIEPGASPPPSHPPSGTSKRLEREAAPPAKRVAKGGIGGGSKLSFFSIISTTNGLWRPVGDSNPCCRRERAVSWASRRTGRRPAAVLYGRREPGVQAGHRARPMRSVARPVAGSTSTTRSGPPPCSSSASPSRTGTTLPIRVPAGSSSSTVPLPGGSGAGAEDGADLTADDGRDQHRGGQHDEHAHHDHRDLQSRAGCHPASLRRHIGAPHRPPAPPSRPHLLHHARPRQPRPRRSSSSPMRGRWGKRADRFLADAIGSVSRSRVKSLIVEGHVTRNGAMLVEPAEPVRAGCALRAARSPPPTPATPLPQAIPFAILYEDDDLIVLDKPAGPRRASGARQRGRHAGQRAARPLRRQPGRDRRRAAARHRAPARQGHLGRHGGGEDRARHAGARPPPSPPATSTAPIWRSAGACRRPLRERSRGRSGAIRATASAWRWSRSGGKPALTRYRTLRAWEAAVAAARMPARDRADAPDPRPSRRNRATRWSAIRSISAASPPSPEALAEPLRRLLLDFPRQALHARRLGFRHPRTGEPLSFETPPPADLAALLAALDADADSSNTAKNFLTGPIWSSINASVRRRGHAPPDRASGDAVA